VKNIGKNKRSDMLKAMKEMEKDLQRGKLKGTDGQIL